MGPGVLRLKRDREARARAHPWIFKGDVADVTDVAPGSAVTVVDAAGRVVGRGVSNPRPPPSSPPPRPLGPAAGGPVAGAPPACAPGGAAPARLGGFAPARGGAGGPGPASVE